MKIKSPATLRTTSFHSVLSHSYNKGFAIRYRSSKMLPTVATSQIIVPLGDISGSFKSLEGNMTR